VTEATKPEINSARELIRQYGVAITIAVVIALVIRFFFIEAYRIPSFAMKPTLEPGDTIFVKKIGSGLRLPWNGKLITTPQIPKRGDVIVFTPEKEVGLDYIKRVVGIPGDTVAIKNGRLVLNGKVVSLETKTTDTCGREKAETFDYGICWDPPVLDDISATLVPEGFVFVIGDLRSKPTDIKSRKATGLISINKVKGKAVFTWLAIEPRSGSLFSRIRFERMFRWIR